MSDGMRFTVVWHDGETEVFELPPETAALGSSLVVNAATRIRDGREVYAIRSDERLVPTVIFPALVRRVTL